MTTFTVGDTAPDLTGTVNVDLTGAVARIHIQRPDLSVIDQLVTLVDPAAGTWSHTWAPDDLNQPGTYHVELEVTFADGKIQTFASPYTAALTVRNQYA